MLTHKGTQIIETPRLILRPFTMEDAQPMFDRWASDPEVTKYITWPPHESVEVTKMVLTEWTGSYNRPDFYNWAITLKELDDKPIGNISAFNIREKILSVTMGYCMGKTWWGQGIMAEALTALVDFFFDEVGCNRIEADHDANNPNSGKVMKKAGMTCEGTNRQAGFNNQGIVDITTWAILRSDR